MANFNPSQLKRIAVYTSGGDAPGMNAAIRAVVRTSIFRKLEIYGIERGYWGMLNNKISPLSLRSVANVIQRGGTMLKTGRCPDFLQKDVRQKASANLGKHQLDALICIGGDGSFRGAHSLWEDFKIPIVTLPGTIDNDIFGTEESIGFDTAANTALEAVDKIRDTAASHDRVFIVEVMGRDSGFLAAQVGLAGGAEDIFIPEFPHSMESVINEIQRGITRGKRSSILIAAEGQKPGRAYDLAEALRKQAGIEAKVCILGHIQRGGTPTAKDRVLASLLGRAAVRVLQEGQCDVMVGIQGGQVVTNELSECMTKKKSVDKNWLDLIRILAH